MVERELSVRNGGVVVVMGHWRAPGSTGDIGLSFIQERGYGRISVVVAVSFANPSERSISLRSTRKTSGCVEVVMVISLARGSSYGNSPRQ